MGGSMDAGRQERARRQPEERCTARIKLLLLLLLLLLVVGHPDRHTVMAALAIQSRTHTRRTSACPVPIITSGRPALKSGCAHHQEAEAI